MFSSKDVGRKILILNNNSSPIYCVGEVVTIAKVFSSLTIAAHEHRMNTWTCSEEDPGVCCVFYEDPEETVPLDIEIGDEVFMLKDTAKAKKGQKLKITEYVDGDRRRLVFEGITPGGWVSINYVKKMTDLSKFRFKTIEEYWIDDLIVELTTGTMIRLLSLNHSGPLSDLTIEETYSSMNIVIEGKKHPIPSWSITNKEPSDLKFYFVSKDTAKLMTPLGGMLWNALEAFFDKPLEELENSLKKVDELSFSKKILEFHNKGMAYKGMRIPYQLLTVRDPNKNNKDEKKPDILPF